jgi:PilZ domain
MALSDAAGPREPFCAKANRLALETLLEPFHRPSKSKSDLPGIRHAQVVDRAAGRADARAERRRHRRFALAGTRATKVNIDDKNAGLLVNLAQGGMRVQALGRSVKRGATVRLRFRLPGLSENIETSGIVAWTDGGAKAGIQFTAPSETIACRLGQWLAKNQIFSAAQEFLRAAGGWPAALQLMAELTHMLTGASGVAISLLSSGGHSIHASAGERLSGRSTIVAPIYEQEQILGHLEICASELGAFDEHDMEGLRVLAALVGEMVEVRAAELRETAKRASQLSARIVNRIERVLPTIRLRLV